MFMERKRSDEEISLIRYLELGRQGHYPLFFKEWINESVNHKKFQLKTSTLPSTRAYVFEVFSQLYKHKNPERQKTFLSAMKDEERIRFVKSFLYLVEMRTLDKTDILH